MLLLLPRGALGVQPGPAGNLGHLAARGVRWQQRICSSVPSMPHFCRGSSRSASSCPPWWREAAQARTGGPGETPLPASHSECVCVKGSVATQSNKRPSPTLLQPPAPQPRTSSPWPSPIPLPVQGQSLSSILSPPPPSWGEGVGIPRQAALRGRWRGEGCPGNASHGEELLLVRGFSFFPKFFSI